MSAQEQDRGRAKRHWQFDLRMLMMLVMICGLVLWGYGRGQTEPPVRWRLLSQKNLDASRKYSDFVIVHFMVDWDFSSFRNAQLFDDSDVRRVTRKSDVAVFKADISEDDTAFRQATGQAVSQGECIAIFSRDGGAEPIVLKKELSKRELLHVLRGGEPSEDAIESVWRSK